MYCRKPLVRLRTSQAFLSGLVRGVDFLRWDSSVGKRATAHGRRGKSAAIGLCRIDALGGHTSDFLFAKLETILGVVG